MKKFLVIALAVLSIAVSGCGSGVSPEPTIAAGPAEQASPSPPESTEEPTSTPIPTNTPEPTSTPRPHVEVEGEVLELREVSSTDSVTIEGQQLNANAPFGTFIVVRMWTSFSDASIPCTWGNEEVKLGWEFTGGGESENGWDVCQAGGQTVTFIFRANSAGKGWYLLFPGGGRLPLEVTPTKTFTRGLPATSAPPANTPTPANTPKPELTDTPVPPTNTPVPAPTTAPVGPSRPHVEVEGGTLELKKAVFEPSVTINGQQWYADAPYDTLVVVEMQVSFSDVNAPCDWSGENVVKIGWDGGENRWGICQSIVSGRTVKFIFSANSAGEGWYLMFPGGERLDIEVTLW